MTDKYKTLSDLPSFNDSYRMMLLDRTNQWFPQLGLPLLTDISLTSNHIVTLVTFSYMHCSNYSILLIVPRSYVETQNNRISPINNRDGILDILKYKLHTYFSKFTRHNNVSLDEVTAFYNVNTNEMAVKYEEFIRSLTNDYIGKKINLINVLALFYGEEYYKEAATQWLLFNRASYFKVDVNTLSYKYTTHYPDRYVTSVVTISLDNYGIVDYKRQRRKDSGAPILDEVASNYYTIILNSYNYNLDGNYTN